MHKTSMKVPFNYFGGKKNIANQVWQLAGDPDYYFEPFAGSLAILLNRPKISKNGLRNERVNDLDCNIINFFRCVKYEFEAVIEGLEKMTMRSHIEAKSYLRDLKKLDKSLFVENSSYYDVDMCLKYIYSHSSLINPHEPNSGMNFYNSGYLNPLYDLRKELTKINERLKNVILYCGDWKTCTFSKSGRNNLCNQTIVYYLDPPYVNYDLYVGSNKINFIEDIYNHLLYNLTPNETVYLSGHENDYNDYELDDKLIIKKYFWERKNNRSKDENKVVNEVLLEIKRV